MLPPVLWRVATLWRVGLRLAGLLLPPVLALVGVIRGRKKSPSGDWRRISPVFLGLVELINWIVLVCFIANEKVGVGLDYHLSRWTSTLLAFSLLSLVASVGAYGFRRTSLIANCLLLFMWFDIGYAPNHLLSRADFGNVKVSGQPVAAVAYIGDPTLSEAEQVALIHVPSVGNYFFDFSSETFREASSQEVVVLPFAAWTWRPMNQGQFRPPLPSLHENECRIPTADGRVITVAF